MLARVSRLLLLLLVLPALLACSMFVPNYEEDRAALRQAAEEAQATRQAAQQVAAAARSSGDPDRMLAAVEALTASVSRELEARTAQAKFEVDSAAKAGSVGISEVLAMVFGGGGALASLLASRKATQAATGPSRAQVEVDEQWSEISDLKAQLAALTGRAPVPPVHGAGPPANAPATV